MDWSRICHSPDFFAAYMPPGMTCGIWIGVVESHEREDWRTGKLSAITMHYPFSFHIQGQGIAIVPTFPVLEVQESLDIKPFALQRLGAIREEEGQYICEENRKLFSDYSELILRVTADKSNLILASPADLNKMRKR